MIKAELRSRPFKVLVCAIIFFSVQAAYIIRSSEYTYASDTQSAQNYNYFVNPLWLVYVTMTTVGYGDYYPRTHMGRVTAVAVCFLGMVSISLLVIFLQDIIEFTNKEQRVRFCLDQSNYIFLFYSYLGASSMKVRVTSTRMLL